MRLRFPFRSGFIYVGRDQQRGLQASIEYGFGLRPHRRQNEIAFRTTGHLSWNWLPDRIYRWHLDPIVTLNTHASVRWTGRYRTFAGFGPWRRSSGRTRIRDARKNP